MSDKFTCAECGDVYKTEGTEEESMKEFENTFGPYMGDELVSLCDDCYAKFMDWYKNTYLKTKVN